LKVPAAATPHSASWFCCRQKPIRITVPAAMNFCVIALVRSARVLAAENCDDCTIKAWVVAFQIANRVLTAAVCPPM
jgi:hypothetical protein